MALLQAEKDALMSVMDNKLKIEVAKQATLAKMAELKQLEHKQKLLQENVVDLNQMEKQMLETLEVCNISYKHVVDTKYYPMR